MSDLKKAWIQTASGRKIFPMDPDPDAICIADIAHALSNVCRYTGHVSRFYSVAEHSWLVSLRVHELSCDRSLALWGLLHDATEAYIADVSRPLKHLPAFAEYRKAEQHLSRVIAKKFGLPEEEPALVKQVDGEMLGTEVAQLMQPLHHEWARDSGGLAEPILWVGRLGETPARARSLFMNRFHDLTVQAV